MSPSPAPALPPLTSAESQHSAAVAALINARLGAAGGWLSFERFMELALYAPGLGYYSAGSVKLGAAGDFVTAPELSDLFGRCVARQCREVLAACGGGILELGAGTGRMAKALLLALADAGALPDEYAILEVSADLAERQRQLIGTLPAPLAERVVWLDALPERVTGVILANEVADALPFRRFSIRDGAVCELGVAAAAGGGFCDQGAAPSAPLLAACTELLTAAAGALPERYCSEVCLNVTPWIASLGRCLTRGMILVSDYGLPRRHYYHPERARGTLRCHFRQRAHDNPYVNVGVQDITAWVDFTRVAEAALAAGLEVAGFATQTAFLLATGIEAAVAEAADTVTRARLAGEARRLLMPEEMGEAFKFMALTRDCATAPGGFALQDLRHLL
jgi:SAM-dependent MidA family methyltransferase